MQPKPSYLWFDFETFGTDPALDRPSQFAAVRTDLDFHPLGEPQVFYCQVPPDYLPHPQSTLITGITPQQAQDKGLAEPEFFRQIFALMNQPGTISVGYNSLRFDHEVLRFGFWRNLLPPYQHEFAQGNSRWDLLDVARFMAALRPGSMHWPQNDQGLPSFKLQDLTAANGIPHGQAHDALADVWATIALAQKLRANDARLYDYLLSLRHKDKVLQSLGFAQGGQVVVHTSGMLGGERRYTGLFLPLVQMQNNANLIYMVDLNQDFSHWHQLSADAIHQRMFTPKDQLDKNSQLLGIKGIHLNRSPAVATYRVLTPENIRDLHLDVDEALANAQLWQELKTTFVPRLLEALALADFAEKPHVEQQLYQGFVPKQDSWHMEPIQQAWWKMADFHQPFRDERLNELLFLLKGRWLRQSLDPEELLRWQSHLHRRLLEGQGGLSYAALLQLLQTLRQEFPHQTPLLDACQDFARQQMQNAGFSP